MGAGLVAGVAAVLVLVGGPIALAVTPVFAVTDVAVPGAEPAVADAVRGALAGQLGRPVALVSDEDVAAGLAAVPAVERFTVVRRPPGTLEVRVVARTPVAQQQSATGWDVVDAARVVIASGPGRTTDLPVVDVPPDAVRPDRAFATAVAAIAALDALPAVRIDRIRASSPDAVVLVLATGARVRWGGAEDGAAKAEALEAALVKAARGVREIDVSSPGVVLTR